MLYSFPVSSPYRDAGGLGADVSGGILLSDHDGAGVVEGLGVLAGGAVGGVLEGEAVGKGSRGGHEEEGSSGTGSLGGESTVEDGREDGGLRCETGERQRHVPQEAWEMNVSDMYPKKRGAIIMLHDPLSLTTVITCDGRWEERSFP